MAALSTMAVKSYAEYEQLVGGVETLFGAGGASLQEYADSVGKTVSEVQSEYDALMDAQLTAMNNADNAYKTAGMSANEYMETITSFAASLKQSTESELEAAEAADQAVIDMADNANKMGTSMESIQNAYQGFAKQNYTMLDNLKLGYGGTKEEMQRLLADAEKLSGVKYDINNLKDVYSAIHVVQTELGITGTTAKEASTTIEGSLNSAKAAWSNLVVGIADDSQNFDKLVDNFVESVVTAAENIIPRFETSITGVGTLIEKLFPVVIEEIPSIINNILPDLIKSGKSMVSSILSGFRMNHAALSEGAMSIVLLVSETITEMLPDFVQIGFQLLSNLLSGISENVPSLISEVQLMLEDIIENIQDWLPEILQMGIQIILQLIIGIAQSLPTLIPQIIDIVLLIVDTLIDNIDLMTEAAVQLMIGLAVGLVNAIPVLIERIPEIVVKLVEAFVKNAPKLVEASNQLISTLAIGLITYLPQILMVIPQIITDLKNKFLSSLGGFKDVGKNIVTGIWNGISEGWDWLAEKVSGLANRLFDAAKKALDINSPSKKFEWLAQMCVAGWDKGFDGLFDDSDMERNVKASLSVAQNNAAVARGVTAGGLIQHIYVNREISTPDELARAVRVESRYGLIRGVAFG